GAAQPGTMVAVMGTSVCNLVVSKEHRTPRGIQGVVKNGILPNHWAYEAGQAGFGDTFGWFARNMTSADIADLASISATSTFEVLESKAKALQPGGSGLIVLDWMNGNRSTLIDSNLSGAIVGLTLDTRDYHIYRALLEGAAFGQRIILEAFEEAEVPIDRFIVCGGIPAKSPLLMQILADVIGMPVEVSSSANTSALGAALHGAIAAGELTWQSAGKAESAIATVYRPSPTAHEAYNEIYTHYRAIHDTFGIDQRSLMHSLREIQANSTH
ncbi:MAG: FGGY-family carbohydrate kinase, partial [Dermabacter sp.]|nr:FGGY-family carbohydrate kinase [Dermabacter sp.]